MPEPSETPPDPTELEGSETAANTGNTGPPVDESTEVESGQATEPATGEVTADLNTGQTGDWQVNQGRDPVKQRPDDLEQTIQIGDFPSDPALGTQIKYIGDYELGAVLGKGGMGIVYRARQVSLNRQVALKLIRNEGTPSASEARRFQHEAEAVASLDHPSIVPIYEVGVHEGRHYFSMKLIPGESLQQANPRLRGKFATIAEIIAGAARGVQHAHERGILHRDLKPANILLDSIDAPHVTDFGLAKRIDTGDGEMTQTDALLGTPAYMAPEQTTATRGAVTIATDVYGLGASLYALLSGRAPHRGSSVLELLDAVREVTPEPPSRADPAIPRDLEVICMKCLDKDPRRRYRSAEEVADDLDRWREGRPISARKVGAAARAVMWCRRRPLIAGLAAALVIAVTVGTTGILVNWLEVRRANVRILAEYETSQSLNEFLVNDMIGQSSPFSVGIRDVPVSALLDRSSGLAASRFTDRPKTEGSVRQALGLAYLALGMIPKAETEFLQSSRLRQSLPADDELDRLSSEFVLGRIRIEQGRFDEAEAHLLKAYEGQKKRLGERNEYALVTAEALAAVWRAKGRLDDAKKILEISLAAARQDLGEEHRRTLRLRTDLAIIAYDQGRFHEALPVIEEISATNLRIQGPNHPETLIVRTALGATLVSLGEDVRAEEILAAILEPARAILGPDHPETLRITSFLAAARTNQKKFAEASQTLDPASKGSPDAPPGNDPAHFVVEINRLVNILEQSKLVETERGSRDLVSRIRTHLPADDPMLGISLSILAVALWEQNRTGEAEPINAEAIAILLKRLPADHPQVVNTESNQAAILLANGKAIEAERLATRVIEIRSRPGWVGNPSRLGSSKSVLGGALAGQKRFGEAEPLLLEGFRIIEADPKAKKKSRDDAVERLIQFYQSQGKVEEAARWQERRAPQPGP